MFVLITKQLLQVDNNVIIVKTRYQFNRETVEFNHAKNIYQ